MALDITPQIQNVYNPNYSGLVKIALSATSAASSAVLGTHAALFVASQDCFIVFAASPTATTSGFFIPKNVPIALAVDPSLKVAAIRDSADGNLYITPLN